MQNTAFITNSATRTFYNELQENLLCCSEFKMSVAFISFGGIQVLLETLQELANKNIRGQIITTSYQNFTQPKVLERLSQFSNIDLKIYVPPTDDDGFHAKGYLFRQPMGNEKERWTVIIGSSNLTGRALKSNIEWNLLESEPSGENAEPGEFSKSVLEEFETLWESRKSHRRLAHSFFGLPLTAFGSGYSRFAVLRGSFVRKLRLLPNATRRYYP